MQQTNETIEQHKSVLKVALATSRGNANAIDRAIARFIEELGTMRHLSTQDIEAHLQQVLLASITKA